MNTKENTHQSLIDSRDAATLIALAYTDGSHESKNRENLIEALKNPYLV